MSSYYSSNSNHQGSGNFYSSSGGPYQQPPSEPNQTFHQGYGDPNAWQQQQQQQQQQQYPQQQQFMPPAQSSYPPQQPQQTPGASFWDPAAAAKMAAFAVNMASNNASGGGAMNDTMMFNLAGEASKSLLQSKSAQLIPGYMEQAMNVLRSYFAVDNRYVVLKMKRILFPFLCKHWKRQVCDVSDTL
jgi:YIF1